jgi:murein DD-endopeptidase MepM/ murein hydrolase activator NlpD
MMVRIIVTITGSLLLATPGVAQARCAPAAGMALKPPSTRPITTSFGVRKHPIFGDMRLHTGIDYPGPIGDPVRAAEAGVITVAAYTGANGNRVEIDHDNGLVTTYSHLQAMHVAPGDCIAAGALIGALGNTGLSVGPHLHFEVIGGGKAVDPLQFLPPE